MYPVPQNWEVEKKSSSAQSSMHPVPQNWEVGKKSSTAQSSMHPVPQNWEVGKKKFSYSTSIVGLRLEISNAITALTLKCKLLSFQ